MIPSLTNLVVHSERIVGMARPESEVPEKGDQKWCVGPVIAKSTIFFQIWTRNEKTGVSNYGTPVAYNDTRTPSMEPRALTRTQKEQLKFPPPHLKCGRDAYAGGINSRRELLNHRERIKRKVHRVI